MSSERSNFGVGFLAKTGIEELLSGARRAEQLGFSSCWTAEDYFFAGAFSTATACAMATDSIEIGIGVVNPYSRHPVLTAMEAAALDGVSGGRLLLGIGASNKRWIEEQMGVPFRKPLAAMKESVEIIRSLIRGESLEYKGEFFQTGRVDLDFEPYRNSLPIYLGVKGPKALTLAGETADGVITSIMTSRPYVEYVRARLAESASRAGRNPEELRVVSYLVINIDEDREKARKAVKAMIAKYLGIHGVHPILQTTGMSEELMLEFRKALVSGESAEHLVDDLMIDTFAIAGAPEECREKVAELKEAGVDHPVAFQIPGIPVHETMQQVSTHLF